MKTMKQRVEKGLSNIQKMFASAINYDALEKAMNNPKSRREIERVLAKVKL